MPRFAIPTVDEARAEARPFFERIARQLRFVPNLHRLMSISPPVQAGFFGLQIPLSAVLDVKTRGAIALAVSEANGCRQCVAAHSYAGMNFGKMSPEEIAPNRRGQSKDPRRGAAAAFARKLIEMRGKVGDSDLAEVKAAGYGDAEIVEIVALSGQYLLVNFMNNVADPDIDFPIVDTVAGD
jgi:uncharacterized peroxidase-related enzyme